MITLNAIKQAKERISGYALQTPLIRMENLDEIVGCQVYVKAECMQKTNAFKIRGALNKMLSMPPELLRHGVVTASSGNHGKGVAFVAQLLGVPAIVVIPDSAPKIKEEGIRSFGATVVKCKYKDRHPLSRQIAKEKGYELVHPYDDKAIIAGQGTIGLEILEQLPTVDAVVVPIGGGGLIGGIATAIKSLRPQVKMIGVEPGCMQRYAESRAAGKPVQLSPCHSIADAILTLEPGKENFPIIQQYVDELVGVAEEDIAQGAVTLLQVGKILAEFSSAIGIAAGVKGLLPVTKTDMVCFVISGGNVDPAEIAAQI